MLYKQTTQVPNVLFDKFLPDLTAAELKILLIIIRQTIGWINKRTGMRKSRDRISANQFAKKTGLSKRIITKTIKSLSLKHLIQITDFKGNELIQACERKGKAYLYYALHPTHFATLGSAQSEHGLTHKSTYNKTNYAKLNSSKPTFGFSGHISKLVEQKQLFAKTLF